MTSRWTAASEGRLPAGALPSRARKVVLTAHVATAVGWLGAVAAYIALDITATVSEDVQTVRAAYLAMEISAFYAIVPLAIASVAKVPDRGGRGRHHGQVGSVAAARWRDRRGSRRRQESVSRYRWLFTAQQWSLAGWLLNLEGYPSPIQVNLGLGGDEAARRELEDRGALRNGRLDVDLEAVLRVLARPERSIDALWLPELDATLPVRVLAAQAGRLGVLAVQTPDEPGATRVDEISANSLAAAVIAQMPEGPAGRRETVTVPAHEPPRERDPEKRNSVLVSHSPTLSRAERDYRTAVEVIEAPHPRTGQIGANVRGRGGEERRSEVLRWFDNEGDGRYLMSPRHHQGGRQWLVAPADARALGEHATALLSSISA